MTTVFQFGERLPQFSVPVLNERKSAPGPASCFLCRLVLHESLLMGNFGPTAPSWCWAFLPTS